jgi:hypothetical protein
LDILCSSSTISDVRGQDRLGKDEVGKKALSIFLQRGVVIDNRGESGLVSGLVNRAPTVEGGHALRTWTRLEDEHG